MGSSMRNKPEDYWLRGEGKCSHCGNEWEVGLPVEAYNFQCPHCRQWAGRFTLTMVPEKPKECMCGSIRFYLTNKGGLCTNCGRVAEFV
jgi:hypothetical protein